MDVNNPALVRLLLLATALLLQACSTPHYREELSQPLAAQLTRTTSSHALLTALPLTAGKIPVSVYNFRDQTGQYKNLSNVSSFSTAVTQGSTSILLQALQDSGWFIPMEREGLQNLLTERKIIRASLKNSGNGEAQGIPPLTFATILLEGGITGYDSNIQTGGLGAKYFGIGTDSKYRVDQVTVHLRAIDIMTGRILSTVTTTKSVLSREVRAGVYQFVSFKRLLEAEGGTTTNEPSVLCVTSAIEKAVASLILEGIINKHWQAREPDIMTNPVVKRYIEEKANRQLTYSEIEKLYDKNIQPTW